MKKNKSLHAKSFAILGKNIRTKCLQKRLSQEELALEYDFDKGNLSKTERGLYSIQLITAWRISEALGIKFSDFAKLLEEKLENNFSLL